MGVFEMMVRLNEKSRVPSEAERLLAAKYVVEHNPSDWQVLLEVLDLPVPLGAVS